MKTKTSVTMRQVASSNVRYVGHDGTALIIEYKPGKDGVMPRYAYPGIGEDQVLAVQLAPSPGSYVHQLVAGREVKRLPPR